MYELFNTPSFSIQVMQNITLILNLPKNSKLQCNDLTFINGINFLESRR